MKKLKWISILALGMAVAFIGCDQNPGENNENNYEPVSTPNTLIKIKGCQSGDFYISNTELTYAKWYEVY